MEVGVKIRPQNRQTAAGEGREAAKLGAEDGTKVMELILGIMDAEANGGLPAQKLMTLFSEMSSHTIGKDKKPGNVSAELREYLDKFLEKDETKTQGKAKGKVKKVSLDQATKPPRPLAPFTVAVSRLIHLYGYETAAENHHDWMRVMARTGAHIRACSKQNEGETLHSYAQSNKKANWQTPKSKQSRWAPNNSQVKRRKTGPSQTA